MKKEKIDFDIYEDITENELDELWSMMDSYTVEYPDEEEIDNTINELRQYVPEKEKEEYFIDRFHYLLNKSMIEISFISKPFWIMSFILFIMGLITMYFNKYINPYLLAMVISPLPFTFGLIEIFKSRDKGMMEIEMSCKTSYGEVLLSKLTIIGFYNIVLNTIFSLIISSISNVDFLRLTLIWFAPFTFISGISLWLSMKIKSSYTMTIIVSIWIGMIGTLLNTPYELIERILWMNITIYIGISILGISMSFIQIRSFIRKNISHKGRGLFEVNY
ncbi:hypothetical protein GOQ27_04270 [Clostridium sp. D2Q-11]|uniref:Uncharacterized protein n=1 Tax=Anaeromonas frigoriresistens TaxID=2683708 RepID=A0A942Z881_9FIRM|nr:hypothetical protein [Anaeromonas frigoriresistens]MBS4537665.1 hypothetical protein [Anaeromonas frigoriresistens]